MWALPSHLRRLSPVNKRHCATTVLLLLWRVVRIITIALQVSSLYVLHSKRLFKKLNYCGRKFNVVKGTIVVQWLAYRSATYSAFINFTEFSLPLWRKTFNWMTAHLGPLKRLPRWSSISIGAAYLTVEPGVRDHLSKRELPHLSGLRH